MTRYLLALALPAVLLMPQSLPYDSMAARAVSAMKPVTGERVLIRVDPKTMPDFAPVLRAAFEAAGAQVRIISGPVVDGFDERLANTDIYVWMPGGSAVTSTDQVAALKRWVDLGGARRELHFHWSDGTMTVEQTPVEQTPSLDRLYAEALEVDYQALNALQDHAIAQLRAGEVRVTTPAGTDVRFRIGDRPVNKQNGDGSRDHVAEARIRIDRHIELPAGIIRVAPLEASVKGIVVMPTWRFGAAGERIAKGVQLRFESGKVVSATADAEDAAVKKLLGAGSPLASFREFALGMNPRLAIKPGDSILPYYGYGAGIVRLSLGDNEELGGTVRGGAVRWNFFPDATVTVGDRTMVTNGQLVGGTK